MMCAIVYSIARVSIHQKSLRFTFIVIGFFAPFFALYILYRTLTSEGPTAEEKLQILAAADEIERLRLTKFGGKHSFAAKIKVQYVRTLDQTATTIERVVEKLAA
jgi:hypothetical protein